MPLEVEPIKGRKGWYSAKGTVRGKRIRRSFEARSKTEARAIANGYEADAWEGDTHEPDPVAFEVCALAYMEADNSPRYLGPLIVHFRGRDVNAIKPGDIQDAARKLYPKTKPATQNRQGISPAQAVINFAADRGLCAPIKVKRFTVEKVKRRAVDHAWMDAFVAEADPHIGALAMFMFTTAARLSEAARLTWKDVDLQGGTAYIAKTKMSKPREAILPVETVALMANLERLPTVFKYKARCGYFYGLWRSTCERAGIDYVPPHQAGRHSFATEMVVRNGIDPTTAASIGGFSPRVLLDTYSHAEGDRAAVEKVFTKAKAGKIRRVK